jgi:hypothetical protein
MFKKILLIFFIILTSFSTYIALYSISEKYFFDKLFYKKSTQHGYSEYGPWGIIHDYQKLEKPIRSRIADLYQLMYDHESDKLSRKYEDKYVVAVIGDSMIYGFGVKQNETLTAILEKKLNTLRPTKILNYSLPGDSIVDNLAKYQQAETHLKPDLYIMGIVNNDLIIGPEGAYPQSKKTYQEILDQCHKEPILFKYKENQGYEDQLLNLYWPSFLEENSNICFLKKIVPLFDKKSTLFFSFGYIPTLKQVVSSTSEIERKGHEILYKFNNIITDNSGYIVDPYITYPEYIRVSSKEGHPAKIMHQQYAQILFDEIATNKKWGFTK